MALSEAVLAQELLSLGPATTEAEAITSLSDAYSAYAEDAESNALPLLPTGLALGVTALQDALAGMNTPGQAAAFIANGIIAFWVAVAGGLSSSFSGATVIVPPPHAGLEVSLGGLFAANIVNRVTQEEAAEGLAGLLHPLAITGGTVTFGVPSFPII